MGTIQKNAPLHPIIPPKKLPSGAAIIVDKAFPPFKIANAFGTKCEGTNRIIVAADIDQKPPIQIPKRARPIIKIIAFGAFATITPDIPIKIVKNSKTVRLLVCPIIDVKKRLVTNANRPEIEIDCPAYPSVIVKSVARGVSKLTGINSDATKTMAHKDIAQTALHKGVEFSFSFIIDL